MGVGTTVLEAGRAAGLILVANCGGYEICGRCRVTLRGDDLPVQTQAERRVLAEDETGTGAGQRLACRARLTGDTEVHVPQTTIGNQQRLQLDDNPTKIATDDHPDLDDTSPGRPSLGVAIDLGSTKIAAHLVDLDSGEQLAAGGVTNPQISYGEDLISRLVYASGSQSRAEAMADGVRTSISGLTARLVEEAGADLDQITDLCLVGNTAMTHLFLGLPTDRLIAAPFAADNSPVDLPAREVGIVLPTNPNLHILPGIDAFVGADQVGVILANGMLHNSHVTLGIDIGTNTELAVSNPERQLLMTASTPAGPIFEGSHISHGMRAEPGAIERIVSGPGGHRFETIDHLPPIGLCGSGVIDALALLWRTGAIDRRGHLQDGAPAVRRGDNGLEYLLVEQAATGHGIDIVITQNDISEVQLAKAAIAASTRVLLSESDTPEDQVAEVVLAGAFGSRLSVDSSIAIGLLPNFSNATYVQVGNSAGAGAKMALVSAVARDQAVQIAARATNVSLTKHPGFNRELAVATRFDEAPTSTHESYGEREVGG